MCKSPFRDRLSIEFLVFAEPTRIVANALRANLIGCCTAAFLIVVSGILSGEFRAPYDGLFLPWSMLGLGAFIAGTAIIVGFTIPVLVLLRKYGVAGPLPAITVGLLPNLAVWFIGGAFDPLFALFNGAATAVFLFIAYG